MGHSQGSIAALIGAFFLLSISLLFGAVIFLSTGLQKKNDMLFTLCFDTSINGLEVGAPVKFRGIRIGSVEKISVAYDPETTTARTPIIIRIDYDFLDAQKYGHASVNDIPKREAIFYKEQIAKGLAGKLGMESFLTGKLFIELDYYDERRIRSIVDFHKIKGRKQFTLIPTITSDIQEFKDLFEGFMQQIGSLDLGTLIKHASNFLSHIDEKTQAFDTEAILKATKEFGAFSRSAKDLMESETLSQGMTALRDTFIQFTQILQDCRKTFPDLQNSAQEALQATSNAMKDIQSCIVATFEEDAPLPKELSQTLKTFSDLAYKMQTLIDYFERNPNAILTGKAQNP